MQNDETLTGNPVISGIDNKVSFVQMGDLFQKMVTFVRDKL